MKLVVLNDLHPHTSPGAASIAFAFAKKASTDFETEFWYCRGPRVILDSNPALTILKRRSRFADKSSPSNRLMGRIWREFISPGAFFWFLRNLIQREPSHIWVHQIGSKFPYSVILLSKLLHKKVVVTLHDFGLVSIGKLYPSDFRNGRSNVDQFLDGEVDFAFTQNSKGFGKWIKIFRRKSLIRFVNLADEVICISDMQAKILQRHGLRVTAVIGNGVKVCACELEGVKSNSRFDVLFAGRSIGKGLGQIIESVNQENGAHLHLAGGEELAKIAAANMTSAKYTYHGMLEPKELIDLIHSVDLVSVLSECYDVYPTITLESLMHRVPVITYRTAGNYGLVLQLSPDFLIPYRQIPDLGRIRILISNICGNFPRVESVEDSWKKYRPLFIA